jgi:protein-L-isoaspartate(D-aspartate) O-methyltransferase
VGLTCVILRLRHGIRVQAAMGTLRKLSVFVLAAMVQLWMDGCSSASDDAYLQQREQMVQTQIIGRGIHDEATVRAMKRVPRHRFVPVDEISNAYADAPLPIGGGQTISQPYIVAAMTSLLDLRPGQRVLEVGTGSGYQAAVLASIVDTVYTIEILPALADMARDRLFALGYRNVVTRAGDGYLGWPEHAPFDAIVITAAAEEIPAPLIAQLRDGGKLVMPVGSPYDVQNLVLGEKHNGQFSRREVMPVRFVPLQRNAPSEEQGSGVR